MKTFRQSLAAVVLFTAILNTVSAQTNLLANHSFEQVDGTGYPLNWTQEGFQSLVSENDPNAQDGVKSLKPKPEMDAYSGYIKSDVILDTNIVGKQYTIGGWVKVPASYASLTDEKNLSFFYTTYSNLGQNTFTNNIIIPQGLSSSNLTEAAGIYSGEWKYFQGVTSVITAGSVTTPDAIAVGVSYTFNDYYYTPTMESIRIDNFSLYEGVINMGTDETVVAAKLPIYTDGNILYVATKEAGNIEVYNMTGQLLRTVKAQAGTTRIDSLPTAQTLIIRSGQQSAKAILR